MYNLAETVLNEKYKNECKVGIKSFANFKHALHKNYASTEKKNTFLQILPLVKKYFYFILTFEHVLSVCCPENK